MKFRDYKSFSEGEYYHIFNRGVGKMEVFVDDFDRAVFMRRLYENIFPKDERFKSKKSKQNRRKLLPDNSFELIAFCLMPNHYHLIVKQLGKTPVSKLILKTCTGYSMYFNKKYGRVGSLFQDVFKSVRVETNSQLLWLSYYVHNNPKKAGLTKKALDYKWSSLQEYLKGREGHCKKEIILDQFKDLTQYAKYFDNEKIAQKTDQKMLSELDIFIDNE